MNHYRYYYWGIPFFALTLCINSFIPLFAAQNAQPTELSDIHELNDVNIEEFEFDFGPDDVITDVSVDTPSTSDKDPGLDIQLPVFGSRKLVSFVDEKTGMSGFQITLTDKDKLPSFGKLTVEDANIKFVNGETSLTGHLEFLGRRGEFSATHIIFSDKTTITLPGGHAKVKNYVTKLVLAATFVTKPTIAISSTKTITLDGIDITLERGKPVIIKAKTSILNRPLVIGFAVTRKTISAFLNLPKDTPLSTLVPEITVTPLKNAVIKKAKLKINNVYAQKLAPPPEESKATPAQETTKEETPEEKEKREQEEEERAQQRATAQEKHDEEEEKRRFSATIKGIVSLNNAEIAESEEVTRESTEFSLSGTLSKKGVDITLLTEHVPIKGLGTLNQATLTIDTTTSPSKMTLTGTLLIQLPNVNDVTATVSIELRKTGIEVTGEVQKDISYAGFTLHGGHIGFDSQAKSFFVSGDTTIQNIPFKVNLQSGRDPEEPTKKITVVTAKAQINEFDPFKNVPGLNQIKATNITAGVSVKKIGTETKKELILNGTILLFGIDLKSTIRFVENDNKEKGIYINAPLTENKTLGEVIPGLNSPPFNEIKLEAAAFQLSSIDFTDPDSGERIHKGLSLLAKVPLSGPLKKAAAITGSKDQDFSLHSTIALNNLRESEFSIGLSRGDPDQTKEFSLGEIALAISGKPSISLGAQLFFRPKNQSPLEFKGTFNFSSDVTKPTPPTVSFTALMQGQWNNAFNKKGWMVEDVALLMGMAAGSPGIPTEFGGTGRLKIKEYLDLRVAFMVSSDVSKIGFEGESKEDISLVNMINLIGEIIDKPLSAKGAPALSIKKNAIVKYATTPIKIGTKVITPGLVAKAQMDIFGAIANLDIFVGCEDILNCGFRAYASLDPINIKNVLKITGYHDEETGVNLDKPKLDIEFTLKRQIVHVSGLINIAEIVQSKTLLEFSDKGIIFDFEESFGGNKLTWTDSTGKKIPLLYARVKGQSSGSLQDPDFAINIVFKQYLKQYLVWTVRKKVEEAKKEVQKGIDKAQREIDKIDAVIADMNKKIESARQDVKTAKADYGKRVDEIRELQKKFDEAARNTEAMDKKIRELKTWYNSLPDSDASKELAHFFNVEGTGRYDLFNDTPFTVFARWEFIGDYYRREIAPHQWTGIKLTGIKIGLLHKGWSTVFLKNVHVGQVWGKNPETGADLTFTPAMINPKGECYGIEPTIFKSTGQSIDHKFKLSIIPKKNKKDNNNWWPSIDISRINRDIILETKGSKAGEYAAKLAALETEKFVLQSTYKGLRDTLDIATKTQKDFEGIIDVGDKFLANVVQPGGEAVLKGSAITSKAVLEGVKQTTIGIMDAGKEIITRPFELFDINEIYYNGSLHDLKDGVLGDVKVVGIVASQHFSFSISIAPKRGFENLAKVLEGVAKKIGDEVKEKVLDPIIKQLQKQNNEMKKEIKNATAAINQTPPRAVPPK